MQEQKQKIEKLMKEVLSLKGESEQSRAECET